MLINVYVASLDPNPNPRGGGQPPNPNGDSCAKFVSDNILCMNVSTWLVLSLLVTKVKGTTYTNMSRRWILCCGNRSSHCCLKLNYQTYDSQQFHFTAFNTSNIHDSVCSHLRAKSKLWC